jgi:hypothetical protein
VGVKYGIPCNTLKDMMGLFFHQNLTYLLHT